MRYRKLAPDNDYSFGNGQLDFYRDEPAAVGQSVQTRLLLWLGEWYLDTSQGTPYMEGVLGKHSQQLADATIERRTLDTTGVVNFTSFESFIEANTRAYSASFNLNTIYGPTNVQLANYINY